jgi:hypothetical protein
MTELENIDLEIEKQKEVVKRAEKLTEHKTNFGNGPWKELARLKIERELALLGNMPHKVSCLLKVNTSSVSSRVSGELKGKQLGTAVKVFVLLLTTM